MSTGTMSYDYLSLKIHLDEYMYNTIGLLESKNFLLLRERLALYDQSFEPSSIDKTFGLRGKGKIDV